MTEQLQNNTIHSHLTPPTPNEQEGQEKEGRTQTEGDKPPRRRFNKEGFKT